MDHKSGFAPVQQLQPRPTEEESLLQRMSRFLEGSSAAHTVYITPSPLPQEIIGRSREEVSFFLSSSILLLREECRKSLL